VKEKNMCSRLFVLATTAALIMGSVDGYAADYELVGFTGATFQGNQTIRLLTEACQAQFSADTRMCNSVEVQETVNWPSLPLGTSVAWMHPVFVPNPGSTDDRDASGRTDPNPGDLSCQGWTSTASDEVGLALLSNVLNFPSGNALPTVRTCDTSVSVACCGPVPTAMVATVPFIGLFGRGLVIALVLSAAGAMLLRGGRAAVLIGKGNHSLPR
jgi:hypothetical protein